MSSVRLRKQLSSQKSTKQSYPFLQSTRRRHPRTMVWIDRQPSPNPFFLSPISADHVFPNFLMCSSLYTTATAPHSPPQQAPQLTRPSITLNCANRRHHDSPMHQCPKIWPTCLSIHPHTLSHASSKILRAISQLPSCQSLASRRRWFSDGTVTEGMPSVRPLPLRGWGDTDRTWFEKLGSVRW